MEGLRYSPILYKSAGIPSHYYDSVSELWDEYTAEAMLFHQKFRVAPNKATGWKRLVGQEVPIDGYSSLASVAGASVWPAAVAGRLDVNGNAAVGAPVSAPTTARKLVQVVNGPQTPKAVQPALDLWVPLT